MKPHPSFYKHALLVSGSDPEECVIIDDNNKHVKPFTDIYRGRGITYDHIEDPDAKGLEQSLRDLGVKI
jgi:FMN phosphatase YigB (HAD superfamily)